MQQKDDRKISNICRFVTFAIVWLCDFVVSSLSSLPTNGTGTIYLGCYIIVMSSFVFPTKSTINIHHATLSDTCISFPFPSIWIWQMSLMCVICRRIHFLLCCLPERRSNLDSLFFFALSFTWSFGVVGISFWSEVMFDDGVVIVDVVFGSRLSHVRLIAKIVKCYRFWTENCIENDSKKRVKERNSKSFYRFHI